MHRKLERLKPMIASKTSKMFSSFIFSFSKFIRRQTSTPKIWYNFTERMVQNKEKVCLVRDVDIKPRDVDTLPVNLGRGLVPREAKRASRGLVRNFPEEGILTVQIGGSLRGLVRKSSVYEQILYEVSRGLVKMFVPDSSRGLARNGNLLHEASCRGLLPGHM